MKKFIFVISCAFFTYNPNHSGYTTQTYDPEKHRASVVAMIMQGDPNFQFRPDVFDPFVEPHVQQIERATAALKFWMTQKNQTCKVCFQDNQPKGFVMFDNTNKKPQVCNAVFTCEKAKQFFTRRMVKHIVTRR
jgi:hypothetical protein